MSDLLLVSILAPLTVAAILGAWQLTRAALRRRQTTVTRRERAWDVILGTDAEIDPLSGDQLRPAVPDIGTRMGRAEHLMENVLIESVKRVERRQDEQAEQIAGLRESQATTTARVQHLEQQVTEWQTVDRTQADTFRAALSEVGIDTDIPHPRPAGGT